MGARFFVTVGIASALAAMTASACNGESGGDDSGSGDSGGGTSTGGASNGGTPNGGSSSGTSPSGGASGNASGGRGGSSGATTGGMSGADPTGGSAGEGGEDSGGNPSGGMSGTSGAGGGASGAGSGPGGSGGTGGAGSGGVSGGASGSGGIAGAAGSVGILGMPCSPRGALACAGNHQKLTVLCGANDTWQPNQTCGAGEFCDSTPGANAGLCRAEHPDCVDGPGTHFCATDDKNLVTCSPDAVSTSSAPCAGACHEDECTDVSACPVWNDYASSVACSLDCGRGTQTSTTCNVSCTGVVRVTVGTGQRAVLRTPWADETCTTCNGASGYVAIELRGDTGGRVRVTAPDPWIVGAGASCSQPVRCRIFTGPTIMYVVSTSLDDGPVNVLFEGVDSAATCPP